MLVSVVVPAYNEEKYIGKCLDALRRQEHAGFDYEVIVVDNNSSDRTAEMARAAGARVVVQPRQGVAWARQFGFESAAGELIASTDADGAPPPDWLIRIVAAFRGDDRIVGVTGPVTFIDSNRFYRFVQIYLGGAAVRLTGLTGRPAFFGPNFAARRDAWQKVGGFDTSCVSAEDVALAVRLARIGKVQFCWDIRVAASARRFRHGYVRPIREAFTNYLRVAWQRRPPLPFENIR
jgi:glycosyltransferase involved in cell wall biosynthesis